MVGHVNTSARRNGGAAGWRGCRVATRLLPCSLKSTAKVSVMECLKLQM
jgi:hypothetical protein